ncbi:MAG: hypothetical protein WC437_04920 [Patescibacteria group bacterium]|jgi:hypothetical protein
MENSCGSCINFKVIDGIARCALKRPEFFGYLANDDSPILCDLHEDQELDSEEPIEKMETTTDILKDCVCIAYDHIGIEGLELFVRVRDGQVIALYQGGHKYNFKPISLERLVDYMQHFIGNGHIHFPIPSKDLGEWQVTIKEGVGLGFSNKGWSLNGKGIRKKDKIIAALNA